MTYEVEAAVSYKFQTEEPLEHTELLSHFAEAMQSDPSISNITLREFITNEEQVGCSVSGDHMGESGPSKPEEPRYQPGSGW